jgi:hypothetical protein
MTQIFLLPKISRGSHSAAGTGGSAPIPNPAIPTDAKPTQYRRAAAPDREAQT